MTQSIKIIKIVVQNTQMLCCVSATISYLQPFIVHFYTIVTWSRNELDVGNIKKKNLSYKLRGDKFVCFSLWSSKCNSATRSSTEMGFKPKCSITNGQVVSVEKPKLILPISNSFPIAMSQFMLKDFQNTFSHKIQIHIVDSIQSILNFTINFQGNKCLQNNTNLEVVWIFP